MRQLHGQNLVANNKARTQASAQTKKQHLSAFVTAHRLHGGVVENFYRHAKVGVVIKVRPTLAKIGGVMQWPIVLNGRGDSHGHSVKLPARTQFLHTVHHHARRERWTAVKRALLWIIWHTNLDMRTADIDGKNIHEHRVTKVEGHNLAFFY